MHKDAIAGSTGLEMDGITLCFMKNTIQTGRVYEVLILKCATMPLKANVRNVYFMMHRMYTPLVLGISLIIGTITTQYSKKTSTLKSTIGINRPCLTFNK